VSHHHDPGPDGAAATFDGAQDLAAERIALDGWSS
jgi:hypothetical protein